MSSAATVKLKPKGLVPPLLLQVVVRAEASEAAGLVAMPPPAFPPTPISSTDISAKDGPNLSSLELSFTLPPPAIAREDGSRSSSASNSSSSSSSSSFRPMSPTSPLTTAAEHATSRRRSLAAATAKENFALPPPPTRSRKIIQMKPRPDEPPVQPPVSAPTKGTQSKTTVSQPTGGKRKPPTPTSVAGRKIARKTAHSLIERRRRSKMNEEFGVLKQMIPACQNQDMHKLAILQASIDYLRYLEQCIADLKANNANSSPRLSPTVRTSSSAQTQETPQPENDREPDMDVDMADPSSPSSDGIASPPMRQDPDQQHRQSSTRSTATTPLLEPQQQQHQQPRPFPIVSTPTATSPAIHPHSCSTSPAILPQQDPDQEAAGALLLLDTDRRGSSGRGMSVKDLLSS
ncbi:hypothetical protein GP486_007007 [Trichoglossum hirsutum]|uniref:BHLH domain-containing protein n=1 Tax=Trichoglossum hirsutum TaxID=265104 RepID=A0A9P8L736_9PEZI|nr:hypothetical protein GP486_007007 [Trichoglossum hirsutum]